MEIEKSPQKAKKLWNIVRIMFYIMRKSISKSKILMLDLTTLLKRGKIASKSLAGNLMLHRHYSALTCRSEDANTSFFSPREYEFSCSNTPISATAASSHNSNKHKNHNHHAAAEELKIMHKVFDILNRYDAIGHASPPSSTLSEPDRHRQLKTMDSPSVATRDTEGAHHQVDKDAEEFIKKFYKDLKNQKRIASSFDQSPSPYHAYGLIN
ncbi:hypothetical protein ABFS83_11G051400 [Erythranthe nasuta]